MKKNKIIRLFALSLFLSLSCQAQVSNWQELGPFTAPYYWGIGRTSCIRFDPNYTTNSRMYVGAPMGGLWMRDQNNSNWQLMNTDKLPNIGISDVAINPSNTNELLISTGDPDTGPDSHGETSRGVFHSTDGGLTWNAYGTWLDNLQAPIPNYWNFPSHKVMRKIAYAPSNPNVLLALIFTYNNSTNQNESWIYKSIDNGVTWVIKYFNPNEQLKDLEFKPGNSNIIYASGAKSVYKSSDNGETWIDLQTNGFPVAGPYSRIEIAVTPANADVLWALITHYPITGQYTLYNSLDGGNTFNAIYTGSPASPGGRSGIAVDPLDANNVYYTFFNDVGRLYFSGTWQFQSFANSTHDDIHDLAFAPNVSILYVSCDGGLNKANGNGSGWSWESDGIAVSQLWSIATAQTNSQKLMCGVQDNGTLLFDPNLFPISGGWGHIAGGDGMECEIDPLNENILYYSDNQHDVNSGNNGVFSRSNNGGLGPWVNVKPSSHPYPADLHKPILIDPIHPNNVFVGYDQIFKSPNYGDPVSYSAISSFVPGDNIQSMAISKSNPHVMYACFTHATWPPAGFNEAYRIHRVYKTIDDGSNWADITHTLIGVDYSNATSIEIDPFNHEIVYVGFSGGWVYKIMKGVPNTGACNPYDYCWSDYSTGLSDVDVYSLTSEKGTRNLYAGTTMGIFFRNHLMNQWQPFSDNLPNASIVMMKANYTSNELFAATHGRGAWKSHLACPSQTNLSLSGNSSNDEYDEADQITSTATVAGGIFARYRATDEITLSPDFTADAGSDFEAYIHNCTQSGNSFRTAHYNSGNWNHEMPTSVSQVNNTFYLFPNPNEGSFILKMSEAEDFDKSIIVTDIFGKTIWQSLHNYNGEITIDISENPKGVYFVKMINGDKMLSKRIVLL